MDCVLLFGCQIQTVKQLAQCAANGTPVLERAARRRAVLP